MEAQAQDNYAGMNGRSNNLSQSVDEPEPAKTPVQNQMQKLQHALKELGSTANSLIDPLKSVIQNDPRDLKSQTAEKIAGDTRDQQTQVFSCALEKTLAQRTADVIHITKRLLEIRSNIRL